MTMHARIAAARAAQWSRRAEQSVTVDLPFPPSVNRIWTWRDGAPRRSSRYETWARDAGNVLNEQKPGGVRGRFSAIVLVEKRRKKRDLDNLLKPIFDLLQEHGVIENDSMLDSITVEWSEGITGARVNVATIASTEASGTRRPDAVRPRAVAADLVEGHDIGEAA